MAAVEEDPLRAMDWVPISISAEASLGCEPNLDRLCMDGFVNCELASGDKSSLLVHLRRLIKVRITAEGLVKLWGQCSVEEARLVLKRVARRCYTLGIPVRFKQFRVTSVRWTEFYRPDFAVDILRLGRHPNAELLQGSSTKPLRVRLECREGGGVESGEGPPAIMKPGTPGGGAPEGVHAEVAADGRVRFLEARSVEELQKALLAVVPILELYKCEPAVQPPNAGGAAPMDSPAPAMRRASIGSQNPARRSQGGIGPRRGPALSRDALALAEPEAARWAR